MYVKISNGAVDQYPYTVGNLRRDNPNTSFPKRPSDDLLADWSMYPVALQDQPSFDERTQTITEAAMPVLSDGGWVIGWSINEKTAAEIQEWDDQIVNDARSVRNLRLSLTDFYALSDVTMSAEMAAYRQALRDITSHANWPHLEEADWPTKP